MYDGSVEHTSLKVNVEDPLEADDQVEVVCPDLVQPGTYFTCHVDIPRGSQLKATVTMSDDVNPAITTTTGEIKVPGACGDSGGAFNIRKITA